jgi:nucleolar protein 15
MPKHKVEETVDEATYASDDDQDGIDVSEHVDIVLDAEAEAKIKQKIKQKSKVVFFHSQSELHQAKKEDEEKEEPGVVYIGRIPHGFYEKQMKAYFAQFGKVKRLRLSRSKRVRPSGFF